jgi:hypothetical protein
MQAELASLGGSMRAVADVAASGRQYVAVPPGAERARDGTVTFTLDVARAGAHVLWGRVLAPGADANSFLVSLDGAPEAVWDIPGREPGRAAGRWTWDPISAREWNGRRIDPLVLDLRPGHHVLRVRGREAGARLDGVLLTDDLAYRPRGARPVAPPARPVRVWLEAESARLTGPLRPRAAKDAAGGRFVEATGDDARRHAPAADGGALFRVAIPRAGTYTLWGRTIARRDDQDSFWVRVDRGRWVRWNGIPRGRAWRWSAVHDSDRARELAQFELGPGTHTIELAYREGGIRLDRLLLTNDPTYAPSGVGGP